MFMLLTFIYNEQELRHTLKIPKGKRYDIHLEEHILAAFSSKGYSSKVRDLAIKALNPDPEQRATVKQLISLLSVRDEDKSPETPKIEDEYDILGEIKLSSVTDLHEIEMKTADKEEYVTIGGKVTNAQEVTSLYLVEHKKTLRRYNAFCITFSREKYALQYCNEQWKQRLLFEHQNIVPICKTFLQRNKFSCYHLYIVKVIIFCF